VLFAGVQPQQDFDNPPGGVAVPPRRDSASFPLAGQNVPRGRDNLSSIRPHKQVDSIEIVTGSALWAGLDLNGF
jgi:hypothetical protein